MEYLFSPWRMKYIMENHKHEDCVFCHAYEQEDSTENLVVHRGQQVFAILNRYPYTTGHIMIVSVMHAPSIEMLEEAARAEMMEMVTHGMQVLRKVYHPQAFNLGANIGSAAGAGIAEHVHFHVVPRWPGDTNFMGTVSGIRVLPEDLADTYERIRKAW